MTSSAFTNCLSQIKHFCLHPSDISSTWPIRGLDWEIVTNQKTADVTGGRWWEVPSCFAIIMLTPITGCQSAERSDQWEAFLCDIDQSEALTCLMSAVNQQDIMRVNIIRKCEISFVAYTYSVILTHSLDLITVKMKSCRPWGFLKPDIKAV